MADDEGVTFPFSTNISSVISEIHAGIEALNGDLGNLHGLPTDVTSGLVENITRDVDRSVQQLGRLQEAIARVGSEHTGPALSTQLNDEIGNLRRAVAGRVGAASQTTGIDLGGLQKDLDKALVDKLVPAMREAVKSAAKGVQLGDISLPPLPESVTGTTRSFQPQRQEPSVGAAYQQGTSTDTQKLASAAAERNVEAAGKVAQAQTTQAAAIDQATAATQQLAKAADDQVIKLDRLSQAQVDALKHQSVAGDFAVDFPTKTTATIPSAQSSSALQQAILARDAATANVAAADPGDLTLAKRRLATDQSIVDKLTKLGAVYDDQIAVEQSILKAAEVSRLEPPPPPPPPPPAPAAQSAPEPEEPEQHFEILTSGDLEQSAAEQKAAQQRANLARIFPQGVEGPIAPNATDLGSGFFQILENNVLDSYRKAGAGLDEINTDVLAQRSLAAATGTKLSSAAQSLNPTELAAKRQTNIADLYDAPGSPKPDVIPVDSKTIADLRSGTARYFNHLGDELDDVADAPQIQAAQQALIKRNQQQYTKQQKFIDDQAKAREAEELKATRDANLADTHEPTGALKTGVVSLGPKYDADLRNDVAQFYTKVGDKLGEAVDDPRAAEAQRALITRNQKFTTAATQFARTASTENEKQTQRTNQDDLFPGGLPGPDTAVLSSKYSKKLVDGVDTYFQQTLDGQENINNDAVSLSRAKRVEAIQQQKKADADEAAENRDRLRGSATDGSYENAIRVGTKLVQDALGNLFRETADGLRELTGEDRLRALGDIGRSSAHSSSGESPGLVQSFFSGFTSSHYGDAGDGGFDPAGLAKSAGITAKYALLGTVLYGVSGAAQSAGKELADFEDSVTNVNVALGDGSKAGQSFFNELSGSAVNAGANLGQSLDVAASAMEAFKDQTGGSDAAIEALGVTFANEASKIAVISNTTITDAAGNLKAATLGFDIPAGDFSRITDVIAGAKQLGGDPTQIGQGLANLAVSFKELGFNAEETGAIISKVQAETDESGTLIASRLTRATTILGGSAGKSAITQLNATLPDAQKIDITGSVRDQILQLAPVYKTLGDAQRQQLVAALGGASAARELIILLQNANQLIAQADNGFTGKGEQEYQKRLKDIAAQMKIIQGEVKAIVVQFTASGILDPFIFLIEYGLKPALDVTRILLQTFNLIPRPLRDIGSALLFIYGTMKLIQAIKTPESFGKFGNGVRSVGEGIANAQGTVASDAGSIYDTLRGRGIGPLQEGETAILGARQGIADAARGAAGGLASGAKSGLKAGAAFATSGAGVLTIGLVAAAAGAATYEAAQRINVAVANFNKLRTVPTDFGADSLRDSAINLRTAAAQLRESSSGLTGSIVNALRGNPTGKASDEALRESTEQRRAADRLDAATKAALARGEGTDIASTIDFTSADGLTQSLTALDDAGYNATSQFNALIQALQDVTTGSTGAVTAISAVNKTRLENAAGLTTDAAISGIKKQADKDNTAVGTYGGSGIGGLGDHIADATGVENLAQKKDRALHYQTSEEKAAAQADGIDATAVDEAARRATQTFLDNPKNNIKGPAGRAALMKLYEGAFKGILPDQDIGTIAAQTADAVQKEYANRYAGITAAQFPAIAKSLVTEATGAAQEASRSNALAGATATHSDTYVEATTRLADLQEGKTDLTAAFGALSKSDQKSQAKAYAASLEQFSQSIEQAQIDTASAALSEMQANADLVEAGRIPDDKIGAINAQIDTLNNELAIPNLDQSDRIAALTKLAAAKIQQQLQDLADTASAARVKIDPRDVVKLAQADVNDDQAKIDYDNANGLNSGEAYNNLLIDKKQKDLALAQDKRDVTIARRNVNALPDSALDTATRALNDDTTNLAQYKKGSAAYYQALAKINQDKIAVAKAESDNARAAARLAIDPRDVIANAQADIDDTQAKIDQLNAEGITSGSEVDSLNTTKKQQELAKQQDITARDIAKRNVDAFPASAIDTANRALADAQSELKDLLPGTADYYNKLAEIRKDQKAVADANVEGAKAARDLTIDLTDPVAVARAAAQDARKKLADDLKSNQPKDVIDPDKRDVENTAAAQDSAAFGQRLQDAQTADSLGQISHQAYLSYLNGEHDRLQIRLAGIKKGTELYRQTFDELQQTDQAIKAASAAVDQQFNIGNIRVPTVFEVQRAVKLKTAGQIAQDNSSFDARGNVSNDYSNKQIILNGVPIEQILHMIKDLYGKKARATTKRRLS